MLDGGRNNLSWWGKSPPLSERDKLSLKLIGLGIVTMIGSLVWLIFW